MMVVLIHIEFSYYIGICRQRGGGFGSLAQVLARSAIPFSLECIVPVATRVGADLLEFAAPESADFENGRNIFKTAAESERGKANSEETVE